MHSAYTGGMPTLQIRNLPEEIYAKLVESARDSRRSLAQEATDLLDRSLRQQADDRARRRALIEEIRRRPIRFAKCPSKPFEKMIREDRDR